jgi:hypothetical protein
MNLNSLQSWSQSISGRCRPLAQAPGPLPPPAALDGNDQALLARLRDGITSAHSTIEGSKACIINSWSLMSRYAFELQSRP